jgi:hypothetical protein
MGGGGMIVVAAAESPSDVADAGVFAFGVAGAVAAGSFPHNSAETTIATSALAVSRIGEEIL